MGSEFHFSDEQVMAAVGDIGSVMHWNLEARLRLMTTGEKWTLYRAIVNLSRRADSHVPAPPISERSAGE